MSLALGNGHIINPIVGMSERRSEARCFYGFQAERSVLGPQDVLLLMEVFLRWELEPL